MQAVTWASAFILAHDTNTSTKLQKKIGKFYRRIYGTMVANPDPVTMVNDKNMVQSDPSITGLNSIV